jgi:hypothetical protein
MVAVLGSEKKKQRRNLDQLILALCSTAQQLGRVQPLVAAPQPAHPRPYLRRRT